MLWKDKTMMTRNVVVIVYLAVILLSLNVVMTTSVEAAKLRVRYDIAKRSPHYIAQLRRAVGKMMALDSKNPTSWAFQANMHGVPLCDFNDLPLPGCVDSFDPATWPEGTKAWAACPHGNLFFLSWHRIYVFYLERLLRHYSGDRQFTISYWNYSKGTEEARKLPAPYRVPADATNPLYTFARNKWVSEFSGFQFGDVNAGDPLDAQAVVTTDALTQNAWQDFSNSVEGTPHGLVHVFVGGTYEGGFDDPNAKRGWMSVVPVAARDPIFWQHHGNIDRLWNEWLRSGDGRENPSSDEEIEVILEDSRDYMMERCSRFDISDWEQCKTAQVYLFYDIDSYGNPIEVKLAAPEIIKRAAKTENLGYRYDDDVAPSYGAVATAAGHRDQEAAARASGNQLGREVKSMSVPISPEMHNEIDVAVRSAMSRGRQEKPQNVMLIVEGIRVTDKLPPLGHYEVYINLPQVAKARVNEAGFKSKFPAHYVGVLEFFALTDPTMQHHSHSFKANITEHIARLRLDGQWEHDNVDVTFVPRGFHPTEPAITFSEIVLKRR
jgi:tyrosinase